MATNLQLPDKFLVPINQKYEKSPEQVLFEKSEENILETSQEYHDDPVGLFKLVERLLHVEPGENKDDREVSQGSLMKALISMENNETRRALTKLLVTDYWNRNEHPPLSFLGDRNPHRQSDSPSDDESQTSNINYQYRQPDGSFNSIIYPNLGKAGTSYAKKVPAVRAFSGERPDPGLLFDLLMARGESFEPNPAGLSSLFFCHAAIITHDIFRTSHSDLTINETSSYLDLSPLYGSTQDEQDLIRTFSNGTIKPDTFSDIRVLGLPPAVSVLLIMYSRFHNYVARTLMDINEGGRFTAPPSSDDAAQKKRDNDLFQVARLVTNGLYVNICVNDYVRAIFNVNSSLSDWSLAPQVEIRTQDDAKLPRGVGGHVSCEFNLLYRFHSILSQNDAKWTTEFFHKMFPGKDLSELTQDEFLEGIGKYNAKLSKDPSLRTFGGLTRGFGGSFQDRDLVNILKRAIEDPAGTFGANCVPDALKQVEIMGILQARSWQVASLNEFRNFLGLKPFETFEEINPDPQVASTLRTLYSDPDNVELYPGLFVEQISPRMDPGTGICAPVTVAGAVLADAVGLIRGDRHMTLDYTAAALTNWGIKAVAPDPQKLGGSKMYHLILASFPNSFKFNSVYAMQPFYTPKRSREIFEKLGTTHLFSFDRPFFQFPPYPITAFAAVKRVLEDQENFKVPWAESGYILSHMLSGDTPAHASQREMVGAKLYSAGAMKQFKSFANLITSSLLETVPAPLGKKSVYQIDVIKDFGNRFALHFSSVLCYLPLKFEFNPTGTYSEPELYRVLANLIEYILYNSVEPTKSWSLRHSLAIEMPKLIAIIEGNVHQLNNTEIPTISGHTQCPVPDHQSFQPHSSSGHQIESAIKTYGAHFTKKLLSTGTSVKETTEILIGNAIAILGTVGLVFANIIDFYLRPANAVYWTHIIKLSSKNTYKADIKLEKYVFEGARLTAFMGAIRNVEPVDKPIELVVDQQGHTREFNKGDRVWTIFAFASRDPSVFPDPNKVNLERSPDLYTNFGFGPHKCLGKPIGVVCLVTMLKAMAGLKNLRRAPGEQGKIKFVGRPNGTVQYMTPDFSEFSSLPTTMKLLFDKPTH